MPNIVESLSHPALEKAIEIMYQEAITYLGRFLGTKFYHELEATWFVTDPIGFNRVISTPFTPETSKSTIDEMLKQMAISSGGTMTWNSRSRSESPRTVFINSVLIIRRRYGLMKGKCVTLDGDVPSNV